MFLLVKLTYQLFHFLAFGDFDFYLSAPSFAAPAPPVDGTTFLLGDRLIVTGLAGAGFLNAAVPFEAACMGAAVLFALKACLGAPPNGIFSYWGVLPADFAFGACTGKTEL